MVYIESIEGTFALESIHGEIYEIKKDKNQKVLNKIEEITVNASQCKFTVDDTYGEIILHKNRKMLATEAIGKIGTRIKVNDTVQDVKLQGDVFTFFLKIPKTTDLSERIIELDGTECDIEFVSELTAEIKIKDNIGCVVFPEIRGIARFEKCTKKNKTEEDVINTIIKDVYKDRKNKSESCNKMAYYAKASDTFYETVESCTLNHMRIIGELIAKGFTLGKGEEFFPAFDKFSKYIIPEIE